MVRLVVEAVADIGFPGFAKIYIRGLDVASADMHFRISRQNEYSDRVLGPNGWQVADVLLVPDEVGFLDGCIVLQVGPTVCNHLTSNTYQIGIPGAGIDAIVYWPEVPLIPGNARGRLRARPGPQNQEAVFKRPARLPPARSVEPPPLPVPSSAAVVPRTVPHEAEMAGPAIPETPTDVASEPDAAASAGTIPSLDHGATRQPLADDKQGSVRSEPKWRVSRRIMTRALLLLLLLAIGAGGVGAFLRLGPETSLPCLATIAERNGIVTVLLLDPSRANQRTTITADGFTYGAGFDSTGHLHAEAPLFHSEGEISWAGREGRICHQQQSFTGFASAFFSAIEWKGTPNLALHVVEPGGRLGGTSSYISALRTNSDFRAGDGTILTFGDAGPDTSRVQLYTRPPDRPKPLGQLDAFVEFKSRGNPTVPPFCGAGAQARPRVRVLHVSDGRPPLTDISDFVVVLPELPCDHYVTRDKLENEYFKKVWSGG